MTDIQARLADINDRARKAQQKRDRQFWSIISLIWIVAIAAVIVTYSVPRAMEADHLLTLDHQEQVALRR
ncbi:hypothetical protein [Rhizobium freirei]|uniref:hypothetical protein n=1 Tax=Rhizobium freirei TaxID=1353277 RepID=UPI0003A9CE92|nr:hypothetical protein [Rhizobium freirei]